jgi:hypothetical protein
MPTQESNQVTGEQKPPVPPHKIGQHKSAEVDALQPTPERKAKTGEEKS